jgi:hypothetical protein
MITRRPKAFNYQLNWVAAGNQQVHFLNNLDELTVSRLKARR